VTLRCNSYLLVAKATGCIVLSSIATLAQNVNQQKIDQGSSQMLKSADVAFAMKAVQDGVAEVRTGKLAAEKASAADVKAFAHQMVTDHTKANNDLKALAEKRGMTLATDMNAREQATYRKLRKLSGAAFDRAYVKGMVKDHQEGVKEFQKEAKTGKDEEIKAFASRTLPMLQQHLEKIRSIQSNMQQSGSYTK
jgi:putative membrane protein